MNWILARFILLLSAVWLVKCSEKLSVFHRVTRYGGKDEPWSLRGRIEDGLWLPDPSFIEDLKLMISDIQLRDSGHIYQVAFERPGDASPDDWELFSMKSVKFGFCFSVNRI